METFSSLTNSAQKDLSRDSKPEIWKNGALVSSFLETAAEFSTGDSTGM